MLMLTLALHRDSLAFSASSSSSSVASTGGLRQLLPVLSQLRGADSLW